MESLHITVSPRNKAHVARLLAFGQEVLDICSELKITPILYASLAVFAYTQNTEMAVNDIDMLIPEADFGRLSDALTQRGIQVELKPYHVLQVLRDGLQLEFDSQDYWPPVWGIAIPEAHKTVRIGAFQMKLMSLDNLIQTYRVGVVKSAGRTDDYQRKLQALERIQREQQSE